MMHAAPAAPSAPAIVAVMSPVELNPDKPPCADRATTGIMTPIRKYATHTHSSDLSGFPSCVCPMYSSAPYAPQDKTAPATKMTQTIDFLVCVVLCVVVIGMPSGRAIVAQARSGQNRRA